LSVKFLPEYPIPLGISTHFRHVCVMICLEINPFVNVYVGNLEINLNENMFKSSLHSGITESVIKLAVRHILIQVVCNTEFEIILSLDNEWRAQWM
jgi:hypothetical protein